MDATVRARYLAEVERQYDILWTKAGILLLFLAAILAAILWWILVAGLVAGVIALVGATFLYLGRRAFPPVHARNIVSSIALLLLGVLLGFVIAFAFAIALVQGAGVPEEPALFLTALVIPVVTAAIAGLSRVFLTYALQGPKGRVLLWSAYAANLAIPIAIAYVVGSQVGAVSFASLVTQVSYLAPLSSIPFGMFAAAYALAYLWIVRWGRSPSRPS